MTPDNSTSVLSLDFHPITLIAVCFAGLFFSSCFVLFMIFLRRCKFRKSVREETDSSSHVHGLVKNITEMGQQKILTTNSETTTELISFVNSTEGGGGGEFGQVKDLESGILSEEGSSTGVDRQNIGWGRWYSLDELSVATQNFAIGNIVGEGGYGIVYRGVLSDSSAVAVAVKKLIDNNKGQAEKDFKVEVEIIGKVRHKNLVGLVGYCAQGTQRILLYEYIDNGNLEQWLHGKQSSSNPLTWDIRLKIATGTAKGLTYLHEGLEPKVIHRDIKSSNVLLDKNWNAKLSDFGLAKLLRTGFDSVATRVMGTFGYVAPEYAKSGNLNESSDVYSFGVLLMEIVSGRNPVEYTRPKPEVNLEEWFRYQATHKRGEELLDPLIIERPSPRVLRKILLICIRCTDPVAENRPKMGQVLHMLESNEFPFHATRPASALPAASRSSIANGSVETATT
ncbi:Protein kinase family protein [Zostera marina]|uniref:non-specific serine/threonine protein kinase n=1 Tax=Zostera marina TaxID=29655 RepID=A0A0K9PXF1_ZOSMR|nr:Protein kinase family protein [Zostera marina]